MRLVRRPLAIGLSAALAAAVVGLSAAADSGVHRARPGASHRPPGPAAVAPATDAAPWGAGGPEVGSVPVASGVDIGGGRAAAGSAPSADVHPVSERAARARADELVADLRLPRGARAVRGAPTGLLAFPGGNPFTPYDASRTRFWTAPGTRDGVVAFYTREYGQPVSGTFSNQRQESLQIQVGHDLRVDVAAVGAGTVGVRVDADVYWTPAKPAPERVPSDVRSVELAAYQVVPPDRVLARRTLTGSDATHLAALVNRLERDNRGMHGCTADSGQRERLTFTALGGGAVVVDGFFCGTVFMTVAGTLQPPLSLTGELQQAVDAALGPLPVVTLPR